MRAGLLLLLLMLVDLRAEGQPRRGSSDLTRFRRRMAGLAPVQRFKPTFRFGDRLLDQSRFAEARPLLQEAYSIARQAHVTFWEGRFSYLLGNLENTVGNHSAAIDHYLRALTIFRSIYLYDQQQLCYQRVSAEYASLGDTTKSRAYQRQAVQPVQEHNRPVPLVLAYQARADKLDQQGKPDSALVFLRQALTVLQTTRQWKNFYSSLDGYGLMLAQMGRYREAEQTFLRCLIYARKHSDHRREMYEYIHLPQPLLHLGRLDEAEQYARMALNLVERDTERQDTHRVEVYSVLTQIAEARGQYRQALVCERLRNQYAERVQSVEKNRQVAEVETRYQVAQKQAHIDQLASDNQRQLAQIGWQAGGLVILLILLGLAGWQYRVIRRVNARLQTTNQTISENNRLISDQAGTLTVLMRELHHRVKNNLAIVSGLLWMQSRRLDDPMAVQAVMDSQRRVEAISLIHQQFYQTKNLAEVPIKAYVTELTERLLVSYGFDRERFDCQFDVADMLLDVEVAVPLGLILNEVLTNAFKYAYLSMDTDDQTLKHAFGHAASIRANVHQIPEERKSFPTRPSLLIRLQPDPQGGILVEVQDNGPGLEGPGLPPTATPTDRSQSLGQQLIRELTGQLGGEMSLTNRQGAYFRLWVPDRD